MRHAHSMSRWIAVLAGLVGAPALWMVQMLGSETLAATVCDRHGIGAALAHRLPFGGTLAALAILFFVLALGCAALVGRVALRARTAPAADAPPRDGGSLRFLAQCGALAAVGFVTGLLFTGIVFHFVEPCASW
ncbi:hypothetical protein ACS0ZG_35410 [Burkholderia gladioli]|uniref:hypothetical protein n=1 Tax=Burkholderia gladioli TaxID=28095 RepID=UPI00163F2565|nr:hypothetical protein [Burkholderia gladioli]